MLRRPSRCRSRGEARAWQRHLHFSGILTKRHNYNGFPYGLVMFCQKSGGFPGRSDSPQCRRDISAGARRASRGARRPARGLLKRRPDTTPARIGQHRVHRVSPGGCGAEGITEPATPARLAKPARPAKPAEKKEKEKEYSKVSPYFLRLRPNHDHTQHCH